MPTEIIHHEGKFVLWTSVCDGPASEVMTEKELRDHLHWEAGLMPPMVDPHPSWGELARNDFYMDIEASVQKIERRINRARRNGASGLRWYDEKYTGEYWIDGDKHLSPAEIIALATPAPESVAAEPNELEDVETGEAKEEIDG
jgi:hypothetical protein